MLDSERTHNRHLAASIAIDGRPKYLIAAEARIHPSQLAGYISGRTTPTPAEVDRLAAVLGVSADDITGGAE
jgi:hypothetical protein